MPRWHFHDELLGLFRLKSYQFHQLWILEVSLYVLISFDASDFDRLVLDASVIDVISILDRIQDGVFDAVDSHDLLIFIFECLYIPG